MSTSLVLGLKLSCNGWQQLDHHVSDVGKSPDIPSDCSWSQKMFDLMTQNGRFCSSEASLAENTRVTSEPHD